MSTLPDIKEALNEFFKLKFNYENQIMTNKKKIINKKFLSKREKRIEYNKLKPKCINCKRPGGTIFSNIYVPETDSEDSYRKLQALCGVISDPCNLNIIIQLAKVELLPQLLSSMEKEMKEYKNKVIEDKNKLLFGFLNTEEVVDRFESIKEYISNLSSLYEEYLENYNKIVDNNEKQDMLNENITKFYTEIQKIKDCIYKMNETNNTQYAIDATNIYTTVLMPLMHTIRELKYNETFVWHNEYTSTCNLIQNKYSIENLSFSSSNDKVVAFDIGYSGLKSSKKKQITILSSSSSLNNTEQEEENILDERKDKGNELAENSENEEAIPIYTDEGVDGVKWNNKSYDKLWSKLPAELRLSLITDHEWLQEFMVSCKNARSNGKPCQIISPKNLVIPPEISPDGKADFGIKIYNDAYNALSEDLKKKYLTFYSEKDGVKNYDMLKNELNNLVAKKVQFNKGYF
jgi:hypothetical protein